MFNLFFRLFNLFCDHEYHVVNEREKTKFNAWTDDLEYIRKSLIYCPKCRKQKWVTREQAKTIINRQKVDAQYRNVKSPY